MYAPITASDARNNLEQRPEPALSHESGMSFFPKVAFYIIWSSSFLFGLFTACFYVKAFITNNVEAWDIAFSGMYHPESRTSYMGIFVHFAAGALIMIFGPMQFLSYLRRTSNIWFHRWNGRLFIASSYVATLGAFAYIFTTGTTLGVQSNIVNTIFGTCILVSATETYRHAAWTKRMDVHQLWAYRLFALMFGNVLFRLYVVIFFLFDPTLKDDQDKVKACTKILLYFFFAPNLVLVELWWRFWRNEGKSKTPPSSILATRALITFVWVAALYVAFSTLILAYEHWIPHIVKDFKTLEAEHLNKTSCSA